MERRLPRGLHDRGPRTAASAESAEKPAGLQRPSPATAPSSPPPVPASTPPRPPSSTPTRPSCAPTPAEAPNPSFPNGSHVRSRRSCRRGSAHRLRQRPFEPTIAVDPGTEQVDSPDGAAVEVKLPFEAAARRSPTRTCGPRGVSLPLRHGPQPLRRRPASQLCTDAQFGKGTRNPVACPAASKIGTVAIETPPLPRRLADRQRLPRRAAQPRPDLRRGVPDLRRRRVVPLRRRSVRLVGKRQRAILDEPAQLTDDGFADSSAGARSPPSSSASTAAQGGAEQPAHLRAQHHHQRS